MTDVTDVAYARFYAILLEHARTRQEPGDNGRNDQRDSDDHGEAPRLVRQRHA